MQIQQSSGRVLSICIFRLFNMAPSYWQREVIFPLLSSNYESLIDVTHGFCSSNHFFHLYNIVIILTFFARQCSLPAYFVIHILTCMYCFDIVYYIKNYIFCIFCYSYFNTCMYYCFDIVLSKLGTCCDLFELVVSGLIDIYPFHKWNPPPPPSSKNCSRRFKPQPDN